MGQSRSRESKSPNQIFQLGPEDGNYLELGVPRKVRAKSSEDSIWEANQAEDSKTNASQTVCVLPRAPLEGYET